MPSTVTGTPLRERRSIRRYSPWLIGPLFLVASITLWWFVIQYHQQRQAAILRTWTDLEMEIVREAARASQSWLEMRIGQHGATQDAAEQDIFRLFIDPIHLLTNGDAWIYNRAHVIFDRSSDFPIEYRGKTIAQIFDLQKSQGASHYEELVAGVMNATEGAGWYIWLPAKGREFVAWTSVRLGDDTWTIGLSTPEPEILEAAGVPGQFQRESAGAAAISLLLLGIFLLVWRQSHSDQARLQSLEQVVAKRTADLARSEDIYRRAITAAGAVPYHLDYATEAFAFMGEGIYDVTGYRASEMTPALLQSIQLESHMRGALAGLPEDEAIRRVRAGEVLEWQNDSLILTRGGQRRWFADASVEIVDEQGRPIGSIGALQDITERKRVEEAEREQRQLAESLQATAAVLSSTLDLDEVLDRILTNAGQVMPHDAGNIMLVESGMAHVVRSHGYASDLPAEAFAALQFPIAEVPGLRRMAETSQSLTIPDTYADANWVTLEPSAWIRSYVGAPVCSKGQVIGFLNLNSRTPGFFSPVHAERLQAFADQAAIAIENARLYRRIQEHATSMDHLATLSETLNRPSSLREIVAVIGQGAVALSGTAHVAVYVRNADDSISCAWLNGLPETYLAERPPSMQEMPTSIEVAGSTLILVPDARLLSDQSFLYRFTVALGYQAMALWLLVYERRSVAAVACYYDMPRQWSDDEREVIQAFARQAAVALENARLYASLEDANEQLWNALQAKDEMIQNVSHELRTPLSLIAGYVELLRDGLLGPIDAGQAEALKVMHEQEQRLQFMVTRLLTLQVFDASMLHKTAVDLPLWLPPILKSWELRAARADVHLELDIPVDLPPLTADRDYLGQVIQNLLDNAIKFSPNGGTVRVHAHQEGSEIMITVSDQGIGIPPDKLERVFERFYQVDSGSTRRFGGLGIGLALCRTLVQAHGGRIWAESAGEGKGSTVRVALPT